MLQRMTCFGCCQVDCPAWAQEINCLSANLDVSAAVRAKARAEYRQVGAAASICRIASTLATSDTCHVSEEYTASEGFSCNTAHCTVPLHAQVFKPHGCKMRPWDAAAFSECVRGQRLIFIGDSTTRQQFQSLACLLGPVIASEHGSMSWNSSSITGEGTTAVWSVCSDWHSRDRDVYSTMCCMLCFPLEARGTVSVHVSYMLPLGLFDVALDYPHSPAPSKSADCCGLADKEYMMPGTFGRAVSKSFWGDLQLQSGASLHARIFGSYNGQLMDDLLDELAPIHASDIIIVNFGAWYPAFAWQVGPPCAGSIVM